MIKFIIGIIFITLVGLISYMLINGDEIIPSQNAENQKTTNKIENTDNSLKQDKTLVHGQERKLTSPQRLEKIHGPGGLGNEIGKNLTLEGIENSDVSDEEKQRMIDKLVYYKGLHAGPFQPLTKEERQKVLLEDLTRNNN